MMIQIERADPRMLFCRARPPQGFGALFHSRLRHAAHTWCARDELCPKFLIVFPFSAEVISPKVRRIFSVVPRHCAGKVNPDFNVCLAFAHTWDGGVLPADTSVVTAHIDAFHF